MNLRVMAAVLVVGVAVAATTVAAQENELGKTIFAKQCAACHGPDGKGNAKMAAQLKVTIPALAAAAAKSDAELLKLLSEGKKPMPSFEKKLNKDELAAVLAYAKTLAKGGK